MDFRSDNFVGAILHTEHFAMKELPTGVRPSSHPDTLCATFTASLCMDDVIRPGDKVGVQSTKSAPVHALDPAGENEALVHRHSVGAPAQAKATGRPIFDDVLSTI
jgi:hypothetical protein